jgi:DNA-binding response OmpR family regulator
VTILNNFHSARILVVDDCWDTASSLTELLAVRGYQHVSWTTDGEAVCQLHASDHYDLIVLDMHMPEVSGLDVMKQLRMRNPGSYPSIIVMTGDECCHWEALEGGASEYIMKPFEFPEFEACIHKVLSQARNSAELPDRGRSDLCILTDMEVNASEEQLPFSTLGLEYGGSSPHSTST